MAQCCGTSSNARFSETNTLFQLFQTNVVIFLVGSSLTTVKEYFGSPIDCVYDGMLEQEKSFVDDYCWKNYEPAMPQSSSVSMPLATARSTDVQDFSNNLFYKKQSSYYRWFPLIFLFQAVLSYIPNWLWNTLRDRRLHEAISSIKDPQKQHSRRKLLIINLANDIYTEVIQKRYAKPFFFCEILNIICFSLNVLWTNLLFQGYFMIYGLNEIGMRFHKSAASYNKHDPTELFPFMGKCTFLLGKNRNATKKEEAVCMLSFNRLCESIFMFLWVWYCVLAICTVVGVSYRAFMMLSRSKRKKLLMECVDKTFEDKISTICEKLGFYSWFTLYRISRNVDPLTFQDIISSLLTRLDSLPVYKTIKTAKPRKVEHEPALVENQDFATIV